MKPLIKLMLKEEFRMHTSYSSRAMFMSFPVIVTLFSFAAAMTSQNILQFMTINQIVLGLHIISFIYGLSVGAFGFLGRQYVERQYGTRNFLVATPTMLPLSFKKTFLGLYIRDIIFYILMILIPITGGLLLSVPFTHFRISSILFLLLAASLSFCIGISLSFFVSVLYIRNLFAFVMSVVFIFTIFVAQGVLNVLPAEAILPSVALQYQLPPMGEISRYSAIYMLGSFILILVLAELATLLVPERFEPRQAKPEAQALPRLYARCKPLKKYRMLLAKELLDLKRSGTITKMFFSFIAPLLFLTFTTWVVNYGLALPVDFNIVFYGGMIGLFGVILYSWLNNVDIMDSFNTIPITVPQVIRGKLIAFLILTSWISTIFVVAIAILNNQISFLWLAIPVMLIVSVYVVVMIAYLTGLRTNTFLFDAAVLLKFNVMALLPIICLSILSFTINSHYSIAIFGILFVIFALGITSLFLYKGIDEKWRRSDFVE